MKMDNQEFEKFIEELYNSFEKYGIPRRVATTIISEAIYGEADLSEKTRIYFFNK